MDGIQHLFHAEQLAIIDQAEQLATYHLSPAFEEVRAAYQAVKIDVAADASKLRDLAAKARVTRAERDVFHAIYQTESELVRHGVAQIDTWMDVLSAAIDVALHDEHPLALRLQKLFGSASTPQDSYRVAVQSLLGILLTAEKEGDAGLSLPDGFVAEGRRLWDELRENREDVAEAEARRMLRTGELNLLLGEIKRLVLRMHAAHRSASLTAERELPGFELAILRAAVGGSSPRDAEPLPALTPIAPASA